MKRISMLLMMLIAFVTMGMAQYKIGQQRFVIYSDDSNNPQWISVELPTTGKLKFNLEKNGNVNIALLDKNNQLQESIVGKNPYMDLTTLWDIPEDEEREALMEIYKVLGGEKWKNNEYWGSNLPLGEWGNVGTSWMKGDRYTVTYLNFDRNNLVGELPMSAFAKLKNLEFLDIEQNDIKGEIPECLKKIKNFRFRRNGKIYDGMLPEHPWSELMSYAPNGRDLRFAELTKTWKVPGWAEKHERFRDFWPNFACISSETIEDMDSYHDYWKNKKIPMADFRVVDFDGNVHCNSDFAKNKLTLLLYWETWCPFSQALIQKLVPAYKQLHSKGLEILGFSTLCPMANPCVDEETHFKYIKDEGITWSNCSDGYYNTVKAFDLFGGSPTVYAVDSNGDIVYQSLSLGYSDLIPFMEEFFGEKIDGGIYTSSDYSKDGEVMTLQTATVGNGINLVFMGDAFVDKEMDQDGLYETKMREAMEQFFVVEPYKSLRNCFTVKAVKAVSPNNVFSTYAKYAIDENDEVAFKYAKKAIGDDADKAMVVVVYNATAATGRSYTSMYGDGSFVAYCMDGVSTVLNHEAGGHGFAFLADEYVEPGNEQLTLPDDYKNTIDAHHEYDRSLNVDYHIGSENIWSSFTSDSRYTSEDIGSYEGAFLYGKGCYRPTENSMMRYNDAPFNAPSREAIYKRIMTLSDSSYKYSHEDFVKFDIATSKSVSQAKGQGKTEESLGNINYTVKASVENPNHFPPKRFLPKSPVLKKGSWKDNQ